MKPAIRRGNWLLATLPLLGIARLLPAQAQIVPAADGTGTVVNPNGNQFNISGGQLSGNGLNLFHSFVQFGVRPGEIANIEASPMLQNILARVVGGDLSVINGLLQVTGGQPNLYLMNPAGILFGPNASLSVPAAFTATTASGIGFGNDWFSAQGPNDYANLGGTPTALAFGNSQPGAIVNSGNLAVGPGQSLNLVGGTVISTGTLTAPGGQIAIAAVTGQGIVRLTPAGSLLSFDFQSGALAGNQPNPLTMTPLALPQLLTAGGGGNATGVQVNSQGQVVLTGSGIGVPVAAGDLAVTGTINADGFGGQVLIWSNGNSQILADLTVQGGAFTSQSASFNSSTSNIVAGSVDITTTGVAGTGNLTTGNIKTNGGAIQLTSSGSIDTTAGILDTRADFRDQDFAADNFDLAFNDGIPLGGFGAGGPVTLTATGNLATGPIITAGQGSGQGGTIQLTSLQGGVLTADLDSSSVSGAGGNVQIVALTQIQTGAIDTSSSFANGGSVFLDPIDDIQVDTINTQGGYAGQGGNVNIIAGRFFRATGTFLDDYATTASISTSGGLGGGSVTIQHGGQALGTPFTVGSANPINGTAGAITTGPKNTILTGSFPASYTLGNIQIKTVPAPVGPVLPVPPDLPLVTSADPPPPDIIFTPPEPPPPVPTLENPTLVSLDPGVVELEQQFSGEYQSYLGLEGGSLSPTVPEIQALQVNIERNTGVRPAFIYAAFVPQFVPETGSPQQPKSLKGLDRDSDELEIVIVAARGTPIRKRIPGATRARVLAVANQFRQDVTNPNTTDYLQPSQQLYQWLIAPMKSDLDQAGVTNLVFLMDRGLRSLPVAALHDGRQFLVEQYSLGLMPSLSLTDTRYSSIKNTKVLAMGASVFPDLAPLPAVPQELSLIAGNLWQGRSFLNQGFTLSNLKLQRQLTPFGIIHLATHSEFRSGAPQNSYIQLWDSQLRMNQLRELGWNNPPVELLVLSACRTALGDEDAELGFAGSAVQAGVKSTMASLWYVSDEGTLGLMTQFYQSLETAPIKAEAMREAQVAMLKQQIYVRNGQLIKAGTAIPLPPELAGLNNENLSHPYYWAAFTLVGNPW